MKKRTYNFPAIALFASLLMLVGGTEKTETETQDVNIRTIEAEHKIEDMLIRIDDFWSAFYN